MISVKDKVYFSHSRKIAGSEEEHHCLLFLYSIFTVHAVVEPIGLLKDDIKGLGIYEDYIKNNVRLLICREYKGFVARGQYTDILTALQNGCRVLILKGQIDSDAPSKTKWQLVSLADMRVHDSQDWLDKFARLYY